MLTPAKCYLSVIVFDRVLVLTLAKCYLIVIVFDRVLVLTAKRYDGRVYNAKVVQKLGISKYITLANHCGSDIPLAVIPRIPV